MALYPRAKHLLIAPGSSDPRITPRVGILHVDAGNAESLHTYFRDRSGGIESHFHIPKAKPVEQYRDTNFQADANYRANDFAISVETQGVEFGEWNAYQVDEIKRLMLWCKEVHGIPLKVADKWDGSGWGYHIMHGSPGFWTNVNKACPGPDRIRQFKEVLVPWMAEQNNPEPTPNRVKESRADLLKAARMVEDARELVDGALDRLAEVDAARTVVHNHQAKYGAILPALGVDYERGIRELRRSLPKG